MVELVKFINGATEITCEEALRLYKEIGIATIVNDGTDVSFILEGEDEWEKENSKI